VRNYRSCFIYEMYKLACVVSTLK